MKEIPLTQGLVAFVDDEDFERVIAFGKWHAHRSGRKGKKVYAENTRWNKALCRPDITRMHRFILGLPMKGSSPVVDHLDGNGLNNQKANLAIKTQAENMQNAPGWNKKKVEEPWL